MDIFSILIGFLVGTATGAAGSYFATKFTENRQAKESKSKYIGKLKEIETQIPIFFKEVREDYQDPSNFLKREFYILNSRNNIIQGRGEFLVYYHESHKDLTDILKLLESERIIWETTETNAIKYQFSNDFIKYIQNKT